MDFLNMDKNMLLSIVNMKLRDEFEDEKDLCSYYNIDEKKFHEKLESCNLKYDKDVNQIRNK